MSLKILYHHRTQLGDAQGIHVHEIIRAFRSLGHQVQVVALVDSQNHLKKTTTLGMWSWLREKTPNVFYDVLSLMYNIVGFFMLVRGVMRERPDFIYERYALNNYSGVLAAIFWKIPIVLEVNSPLVLEQSKLNQLVLKRVSRFFEKWICSHATRVLVVTEVLKSIMVAQGIPMDKITVMPNGIDSEVFNPKVSGQELRKQYGFDHKIVIGFVGWFRQWHGLEILLEIVHEAYLSQKNVRLLLVGDGPAFQNLFQYAQSYDLSSVVTFTGPIKHAEIAAHIAAMDIAVQPSAPSYACPMKIIEYMGMGKCILAPDQPNVRELIVQGVTGELFHPEDKASLLQALIGLVNNHRKRELLGRKALESLQRRGLYWSHNAEKVISLVSQENFE